MKERIYHYIPGKMEHPGVLIEEKLQEMEMSVKEFALRADKTEQSVLDVIQGKCSITPEMAILAEYVTGMSAEVLLNWQKEYDARKAWDRFAEHNGKEKAWVSAFPVEEMVENGWMERKAEEGGQMDSLLRYFGVASPSAWENCYMRQRLKVAFRISLNDTANPYSVAAWLRQGEIQASNTYLEYPYDAQALKEWVPEVSFLLQNPPEDCLSRLTKLLAGCGVKLFFTEPLSGLPIKGAVRWIYGWPCIQLLSERQFYGNFRFTVLHELGHILLHGKKDIFLEHAGFQPNDDPAYDRKEREADSFARKWEAFPAETR